MYRKLFKPFGKYLLTGRYRSPLDWAVESIDFSDDKGASKRKLDLEYSPFLRDPIAAWDFDGVKKEVTVVAPEQTGKTLCWLVGLLWSFIYKPCISLVVYKSDEKAEEINSDKMKPLMRKITSLAEELLLPRSNKKDCYNFSNLKSYFMGSGSRITSSSSKIRVADEVDDWIEHEGQVSHLDDMRKRARSFDESILYKVCSPKQGGDLGTSRIWEEFKDGSKGYWHLMCLGCGQHTIRSCDTHHLQFESEERKVIKGSCILVCPKCNHKHTEDKKPEMNKKGVYIHKYPDLITTKPSFQWGCLASSFEDFNWENVAEAQLVAGSSGSIEKQVLYDNSYRGLPHKTRKRDGTNEKKLKSRCVPIPDPKEIWYRLMGIDTQGYSFFWRVRGYDAKRNGYGIASGEVENIDELTKLWQSPFLGGQCNGGIIDVGGHRSDEVKRWVKDKAGLYMYKGRGQLALKEIELSREQDKLLLVNPNIFKALLIYKALDMEFGESEGWYLEPEPDKVYMDQMLDYKKDNKKQNGHLPVNWVSSGNEHLFDCEKMLLAFEKWFVANMFKPKNKKVSGKK